jgi:hypothetical protein
VPEATVQADAQSSLRLKLNLLKTDSSKWLLLFILGWVSAESNVPGGRLGCRSNCDVHSCPSLCLIESNVTSY